jgi:hypothetical protein
MIALVRKHLPARYVSESNSDATCILRAVMAVSELFTIGKVICIQSGSSVYLNVFATKRDFVSSAEIRNGRIRPFSYPVKRVKKNSQSPPCMSASLSTRSLACSYSLPSMSFSTAWDPLTIRTPIIWACILMCYCVELLFISKLHKSTTPGISLPSPSHVLCFLPVFFLL